MSQEVSCKIIRTVLDYARAQGGDRAVERIVEEAAVSVETLSDENAWIDHAAEKRIFRALDEILGEKNAAYKCGEYGIRVGSFGALETFIRALLRPKNVYGRVPYIANRLAKVGTMSIAALTRKTARVQYRYDEPFESIVEICENRRGMLAAIPVVWGLPPATVDERECSARGGEVCDYRIEWSEPLRDRTRLRWALMGAAVGAAVVVAAAYSRLDVGRLESGVIAVLFCVVGWVIGHALDQARQMAATRQVVASQNEELSSQLLDLEAKFRELDELNNHLEEQVAKRTAQLEQSLARLRRVNALSREIGETLAQDEIVDVAFRGLEELVGATGCLLQPSRTRFDQTGGMASPIPERREIPPEFDKEVVREVAKMIKSKRAHRTADLVTAHMLCLPLSAGDEVLGNLTIVRSAERGEFSDSDIEICRTFADIVTAALTNALLFEKTELLSITDGLTGLFVFRYFREALSAEVERAARYEHPFVLMMIDLDDFKDINDNHGHQVGNAVLRSVAGHVKTAVRASDISCRFGGEEFAVILPHTDIVQARVVADRLRDLIGTNNVHARGARKQVTLHVTVSVGIAAWENGLDVDGLIRRADAALCQAKRGGKNCVSDYAASQAT